MSARIRVRKEENIHPSQHLRPRPRGTAVPCADAQAQQQILPPNNQPRSGVLSTPAAKATVGVLDPSARKPQSTGKQTSQPIQPGAAPFIQASANSSRKLPTAFFAVQCEKLQYVDQHSRTESPTHAPGLEARAAASRSSGLAAGGRRDKASQSQLQRWQDPLAVSGSANTEFHSLWTQMLRSFIGTAAREGAECSRVQRPLYLTFMINGCHGSEG
ncbi:hypothetical protein MRX96_048546 [Rhipicephalus microplus]